MQNKICSIGLPLLLLYFIASATGYAQEINIDLKTVDSLITTNTENRLFDVNGEICSMIIFTTDLKDLKFYSNLGVEKIIKIENGYKIWIPNQTTILKFSIPGFPLFEYKLPPTIYKYSVYIISLKAENYEKIIVKDTIQPSLSIYTTPKKARIFINEKYRGKSPMFLKNPDLDKFEYSIKKIGYSSHSSNDSLDVSMENISVKLTDLSRTKRYFLLFNINSGNYYSITYDVDKRMPKYGLTFGVFGKTGVYGSIKANQYNMGNSDNNTSSFRNVTLIFGMTQQIVKPLFIYGGLGYFKYKGKPLNSQTSLNMNSLGFNTGLILRIGWYSVIQLDLALSTESFSSAGIGLGYNFTKKQRTKKVI